MAPGAIFIAKFGIISMKVEETLSSKLYNFFNPLDWAKRALLISISQTLLLGAMEFVILRETLNAINLMFAEKAGSAGFIIVYFVLFIIAQIFSTAMAADAWVAKNTMQVVAVALFNIFTCIYSVVQIFQLQKLKDYGSEYIFPNSGESSLILAHKLEQSESPQPGVFKLDGPPGNFLQNGQSYSVKNSVSNLEQGTQILQSGADAINSLLAIAVVIAGLSILYGIIGIFTSFKVYQEYGWSLLQKNGASLHKKKLLKRYHLFILFLKLNIFFFCGIIIQMIGAVYYYGKQAESNDLISAKRYVASACALMCLVAVIYYTVGWFAVKRTSYALMILFLVLMLGNAVGLVYAIVVAFVEPAFKLTLIWLTSFGTFYPLTFSCGSNHHCNCDHVNSICCYDGF